MGSVWPSLDYYKTSQLSMPPSLLPFGNVLDKPFIVANGASFVPDGPGIHRDPEFIAT